MDAAACIGCGACVAACPNGAAQLFTAGEAAAPQPDAAGSGRALGPHGRDGRDDGVVLRLVHEPPRVRSGVPEVDLDRLHRADEPRLREGAAQAAPPRRPAVPVGDAGEADRRGGAAGVTVSSASGSDRADAEERLAEFRLPPGLQLPERRNDETVVQRHRPVLGRHLAELAGERPTTRRRRRC